MKRTLFAVLVVAAFGMFGTALQVAAGPPDQAIIANGGSTNTAAWRITVQSDGNGVAYSNLPRVASQAQGAAYIVPLGSSPGRSFSLNSAAASRFFHDVAAAKGSNARGTTCMKSASFGSTTVVKWHDWVSPDLECPQSEAPLAQLSSDARAIEGMAGIGPPRRVQLPAEPRQTAQP